MTITRCPYFLAFCLEQDSYFYNFGLEQSGKSFLVHCPESAPNLDLLKVDLKSFSVSGASFLGCKAAKQVAKSWEVELSCLKVSYLCFVPKLGTGMTRIWSFRLHLRVLSTSDIYNGMCVKKGKYFIYFVLEFVHKQRFQV